MPKPYLTRPRAADAKVRKLIRKLEQLVDAGVGGRSTKWEQDFLTDIRGRIAAHGSAFADPEKGSLDQSLSYRQDFKVAEIRRLIRQREKKPLRKGAR